MPVCTVAAASRISTGTATSCGVRFHGFAWGLDGALADVPARWDFPHVDAGDFHLPEAAVGTWAGFVFVNPDPTADSFEAFVEDLADQFAVWDLANFHKEAHVARVLPANWKIAQEAFCEAFHVNATHPQILTYLGDTNSQVDIWDNCARVITPGGTPSPLLDWEPSQDEMMRAMLDLRLDEELNTTVPKGQTARAMMAEMSRTKWRPVLGARVEAMSDAELVDSIDYTLFPNFHPWGGLSRIVYRFRPNGDDHRSSIMDVMLLSPFAGARPAPAPVHWLADHEQWTDAPELGLLAKVFQQDSFNMGKVQLGLETTAKAGVTLGNYQESKIRWLHQKLGEWIEATPKESR
jgi:phenylpropionate dioxygenase-like ring-hydroxylating dioxygenase large terminal subunit